MSSQQGGASMEEKNKVAQEKYGADFDELEGKERQSVGGTIGGNVRKEAMTKEHGGDTHEAYSEMGRQGGQATNKDSE